MKYALSMCSAALALVFAGSVTFAAQAVGDYATPNATSLSTANNPETLVLDARDAARGLMHSHMTIPVKPGPFTLVYPKWVPGEHGPTGPLHDLAALRIHAGIQTLSWRRDEVNLYAFHVDVPSGVSTITVDFDVLLNAPGDVMSTKELAIVNWNRDILYQSNTASHNVYVRPSILLPANWSYGTALPRPTQSGNRVNFAEAPLNLLVDSPLDMGRYAKHLVLWTNGGATQYLDAFADHPQDLDFPKGLVKEYDRMTPQALALYGARHWNDYHSLLTLSDQIGFQGIEHHQSSDDRAPDDFMTNPADQVAGGDLLTHEFSHSWNGKYRRPYDLFQLNFQVPERTELLWVYEGMNQYLGDLLSFRMGIREPKQYPEYLASIYAAMDNEPGRATEPIIDLTTAAPYLYQATGEYSSIRRTAGDFYTEGELIWLDVDAIIRQKTGGKKSLDTFLHAYAGPPNTGPITVTYTRAQIEALLNGVVAYDWHGFFEKHVYDIAPRAPQNLLARTGWKIVYTDKPNTFDEAADKLRHSIDDWYSLGLQINAKGTVSDVKENSPAWTAGLSPGTAIVAVDGQSFTPAVLDYAIKQAQTANTPIRLLAQKTGWFGTYTINYRGGLRYPHLVRIPNTPDMLAKIMAAH